jgi:DNA-binding YbaB/EbfC family protein
VFEGLGKLANLGSVLKQAQQMSGRLQQLQEDLKQRRAEGAAGGGLVTVEVNGLGEVLSCRIDPSLVTSGDRELIEDLVPAAVNQAVAKSRELYAEAMKSMASGMDIPGLGSVLSQLTGGGPEPPPAQ